MEARTVVVDRHDYWPERVGWRWQVMHKILDQDGESVRMHPASHVKFWSKASAIQHSVDLFEAFHIGRDAQRKLAPR